MSEPGSDVPAARSRSEMSRRVAIAILATVATLFAVFNLDEVEVNLLFGKAELPLIVVIVACLLIGGLLGAFLTHRRGARRG
jgi:uncharacterized integral membrane protein